MKDVRWAFAPRVPGTHTFPETNVRTYVHRDGEAPGVWFFSLDAMNRLAVLMARTAFSLPYFLAWLSLVRTDQSILYRGERERVGYEIRAEIGQPLPAPCLVALNSSSSSATFYTPTDERGSTRGASSTSRMS